jgi:hypothetical protein
MLGIMSEAARILTTTGSVGRGGDHDPADVRCIQNLPDAVTPSPKE